MNFRITEILNHDTGSTWTEIVGEEGFFEDGEEGNIGIIDILFDRAASNSAYEIIGITRVSDNVVFRKSDILNVGGIRRTIEYFHIELNQLKFVTRSNNRIPLAEAVKYVAPATQQRRDTGEEAQNLSRIEARILANNPRPIRLKRLLKRRTETPKQFLIKFFAGGEDTEAWNLTRDTIFADDNTVQTPKNKRRSLGDIFMILKYYYPNITLKEVIQLLYVDLMNELHIGLRTSNCSEIHKRVWYYDEEEGGQFMESGTRDEYGNNKQHYLTSLL